MDEFDKITANRQDLLQAGRGQLPAHVVAWLDGREVAEHAQTGEDTWTWWAKPLPTPGDDPTDDVSAEAVALFQPVLDAVAEVALPALVEVLCQREDARSLAVDLEAQNARLVASLTAVVELVPPQSWAKGTDAVETAKALLADLQP